MKGEEIVQEEIIEEPPLAILLVEAIIQLLFLPQFTIDTTCVEMENFRKRILEDTLTSRGKIIYPNNFLWTNAIGYYEDILTFESNNSLSSSIINMIMLMMVIARLMKMTMLMMLMRSAALSLEQILQKR